MKNIIKGRSLLFSLFICVLLVCVCAPNLLAQRTTIVSGNVLTVGVEAFIPNDLAITRRIGGTGEYSGQTGLAGPFKSGAELVLPGEPTELGVLNECFLDDQRSWRTFDRQTSRVRAQISINLDSLAAFNEVKETDFSYWVGCSSGNLIRKGKSDSSGIRWRTNYVNASAGIISLNLSAEASNGALTWNVPTVGETSIAPDIDYKGDLHVAVERDRSSREIVVVRVTFHGQIDQFPAYEAWSRLGSAPYVRFAGRYPNEGKTPANLYTFMNSQNFLSGMVTYNLRTGAVTLEDLGSQ